MSENKTVRPASEPSTRAASRFSDPARHYVKVPRYDEHNWPFHTDEEYLDIMDPETGEPAYKVEFDGAKREDRSGTGLKTGQLILSCSKDYAARMHLGHIQDSRQSVLKQVQKISAQNDKLSNLADEFSPVDNTPTMQYYKKLADEVTFDSVLKRI